MPLPMTQAALDTVRGTNTLQWWFFSLSSKSPKKALVIGAHLGKDTAEREARKAGGMVKGGYVSDGMAIVDSGELDKFIDDLRAKRAARPWAHTPNVGKRRGRIVRKVDPLQEKLGVELLMGDLITLDGTVYLVGGFVDGGQKVELWRESLAHAPNASDEPVPIANPDEFEDDKKLYLFTFGAYGWTKVYVWADHDEDAFEIAVEWLDDNAPGHLTDVTEDDLKRSAEDLNVAWQPTWPDWDDAVFSHVAQNAEADLTQIGHTTLKHGQYLHSWEWAFDEVTDPAEYERIAEESADEEAQIPNPGTFPSEAAGWRAAREPRVVRLEDGGPLLGWEIYSTSADGSGKTFHGSERTLRAAQAWALANLNVARFDTAEPIGSGRKRRRSEP